VAEGRKFIPYTPFTAVTPDAVRKLINTSRENGYTVLEQQLEMKVRGIAVPIRNREGDILGAVSVSLPMGNETKDHAVARALPVLREAEYALLSVL
jgi:IclR family pca regulon transcriptional regulator